MRLVLILVFLLGALPVAWSAGRVEDAVATVAASPNDRELRAEMVNDLKSEMTDEELARQLLDRLWTAEFPRIQTSCIRMMLDIDPFPFDLLDSMIGAENSSDRRAYLLYLLHRGAKTPAEVDSVLSLAKASLKDVRPGLRRFGEAKAYSEEGLRVCDVAYNVLVERLSLASEFPPLDADNFSVADRDKLVSALFAAPAVVVVAAREAAADPSPAERRPPPSPSGADGTDGEPGEGGGAWIKWPGVVLLLLAVLFFCLKGRRAK